MLQVRVIHTHARVQLKKKSRKFVGVSWFKHLAATTILEVSFI